MNYVKKESKDLQIRIGNLSKETQRIICEFLEAKSASSRPSYKSAIVRTFEALNNKKIEDLIIEDYDLALNLFEGQTTNLSLIKSFFRDIHKKELIKCKDDFTLRFYKEEHYHVSDKKRTKQKNKTIEEKYTPALTFEQIKRLQEFLSLDFDDISKLKASFACYMMFCTDCPKEEFEKVIKATDYSNGKITTSLGSEYIVPKKYEPVFESKSKGINKGFNNLYDYLKIVEPIINYENLIPQVLINSRNQNKLKCSMCGEKYFNLSENWVCVANRIICKSCGEKLKKNSKYELEPIESIEINTVNLIDEAETAAVLFGYDKLKYNLLNKTINFNKLHEFYTYIGKLGEAYVYKQEKLKLKGTEYEDLVDDSPSANPHLGYDIKSYTFKGEELYIEVKTEAKNDNNDFFLSANERKKGEDLIKQGKKYCVYRVHNILTKDESKISIEQIDDLFNNSKYKFVVNSWKIISNEI